MSYSQGRKQFGPRSVVCSECGKRGVANLKVLDKDEPVVCGDCREAGRGKEEG